jgi:hypothetical protein
MISERNLAAAGDVNRALEQFYTDTLAAVLADEGVAAAGVSKRALRIWFDKELLTETGIRNTVLRNESSGRTGSLPNAAVDALARRFLLRTELRGGGAWVELVHDRFVEPIRASNAAWFPAHLSTLQRQADLWRSQGRPDGLLLTGEALFAAEVWAMTQRKGLEPHEREFLAACQAAQAMVERERRQSRRIRMLFVTAMIVSILAIGATARAWKETNHTKQALQRAEVRIEQMRNQASRLGVDGLLTIASKLDEKGDTDGAERLRRTAQTAIKLDPALLARLNVSTLSPDDLGFLSSAVGDLGIDRLLSLARDLNKKGDKSNATSLLSTGIKLKPTILADLDVDTLDPDSSGLLTSTVDSLGIEQLLKLASKLDEEGDTGRASKFLKTAVDLYPAVLANLTGDEPNGQFRKLLEAIPYAYQAADRFILASGTANQQAIDLPAFWIGRTQVTNAQYARCVQASTCQEPGNTIWRNQKYAKEPVTNVSWDQAEKYAKWVKGRLPTEAEWEKACRETNGRIMATNVSDWTSSKYRPFPYNAADDREEKEEAAPRMLRGGANDSGNDLILCTKSDNSDPTYRGDGVGFRVVLASPGF